MYFSIVGRLVGVHLSKVLSKVPMLVLSLSSILSSPYSSINLYDYRMEWPSMRYCYSFVEKLGFGVLILNFLKAISIMIAMHG